MKNSKLVELFAQNIESVKYLNLSSNSLDQIPVCVFDMRDLIELNLSGNMITNINDDIELLQKLEVLNVNMNQIRILKNSLGRCKALTHFSFEGNVIIKPGQ